MGLVDPALEYYVAVVETGSVNGAARRLHVASSAISRQVARLESTVGTTLLVRSSSGVMPTEAGREFAGYARRAIAEASTIVDVLQTRPWSATVSVAASEGIVRELLPRVAADFVAEHPEARVRLLRVPANSVSDVVREGAADIGATFSVNLATGVEVRYSGDAALHAIMRPGHPLASRDRLSFRDVASYPLAVGAPGATNRALVDVFGARRGRPLEPTFESDDPTAVIRFVLDTDAIAVFSLVSLSAADRAALAAIPLRDREFGNRTIQVQTRIGRPLHAAAEEFAVRLIAAAQEPIHRACSVAPKSRAHHVSSRA